METARRATEADISALNPLAAALRAELREHRGGDMWELAESDARDPESRFAAALALDDELVIVGEYDGAVCGYAWAVTIPLADGRMRAVIPEIYVDPAARKVGLGEAILDAVTAWAIDQECVGLDAMALPGTRDTKNFFETAGMKARMLIVHRELP
jgi:ribosomal protein S18 acetylase RimI-like enzyme